MWDLHPCILNAIFLPSVLGTFPLCSRLQRPLILCSVEKLVKKNLNLHLEAINSHFFSFHLLVNVLLRSQGMSKAQVTQKAHSSILHFWLASCVIPVTHLDAMISFKNSINAVT